MEQKDKNKPSGPSPEESTLVLTIVRSIIEALREEVATLTDEIKTIKTEEEKFYVEIRRLNAEAVELRLVIKDLNEEKRQREEPENDRS